MRQFPEESQVPDADEELQSRRSKKDIKGQSNVFRNVVN